MYDKKLKLCEMCGTHDFYTPLPPVTNCHTFLDPLSPSERDVLYVRTLFFTTSVQTQVSNQ
jgi:hypothetical protein